MVEELPVDKQPAIQDVLGAQPCLQDCVLGSCDKFPALDQISSPTWMSSYLSALAEAEITRGLGTIPVHHQFHHAEDLKGVAQQSQPLYHVDYTSELVDLMASSPMQYTTYPPLDMDGGDAEPYQTSFLPTYETHHDPQQERYNTPPAVADNLFAPHPLTKVETNGNTNIEEAGDAKSASDAPSPGRSKPVPKPDRPVTKDANGRYYCDWPGCTEEIRDFNRKCEWSKHMDKHDRPYKCPADGCEKLPGFTYSGGLLRHEREVHNKHGGPKKQLNCPHQNCKRHQGKGFSRQENLNEHLRRVHTGTEDLLKEETEDDGGETAGNKRKRIEEGGEADAAGDEMKRLKLENDELKRQIEVHVRQNTEMKSRLYALTEQQNTHFNQTFASRMQAPAAQMI